MANWKIESMIVKPQDGSHEFFFMLHLRDLDFG